MYKLANQKMDIGDYFNALELFKTLYQADSTDKEINFKMGVCYFNLKRYKSESLKYFLQSKGYENDEWSYYVAVNYHMLGNYDKALEHFYKYQNLNYEKEHSFKEINDLIAKCIYAQNAENNPLEDIVIENLGNTINTPYAEYAPLIPADESFLVFTTKNPNNVGGRKDGFGEYYEDILISKKINDAWVSPKSISHNINTPGNDACTGLSADGQKIIIYRSDDTTLKGNFYTSVFEGTNWTTPHLLEDAINSKNYIETSACYSPDGQTIFFSSDMPGGYGGKDIYMIKKLPNGEWGKTYNLGNKVNTIYDEDAPFVHPRNSILFFSSQGHSNNMGGYDIFKSTYDKDYSIFSIPENIGYPINTNNDDIFFVLNTNGTIGYFSSERNGGFGLSDIYSVDFASNENKYKVVLCRLVDEKGNSIAEGKIELSDDVTNELVGSYTSNQYTGCFIVIVEPLKKYKISVSAIDYITIEEEYVYKSNEAQNKKFVLKK